MFTVIATRKDNSERKILGTYHKEEDAEKFCEMWAGAMTTDIIVTGLELLRRNR